MVINWSRYNILTEKDQSACKQSLGVIMSSGSRDFENFESYILNIEF